MLCGGIHLFKIDDTFRLNVENGYFVYSHQERGITMGIGSYVDVLNIVFFYVQLIT